MKILYTLITLFFLTTAYPQDEFLLNSGSVNKKEYFTVISYKEVKGKIIVQCSINDKPYNFIVDTGAPVTITQELYNELQPKILSTIDVSDQSGKKDSMQVVSISKIRLGDITFTDTPTLVSKSHFMFECFNVDGILGSNMFRNSVLRISDREKKITISDSPKNFKLKSRYASKMHLSPHQSNPYIEVKQQSDAAIGKEMLLFDSGMSGFYDLSVTAYEQFKNINLFKNISEASGTYSIGLHGLAENQVHYKAFLPELSVNKYVFKNLTVKSTHDETSRIGSDIFKYGDVTLDYRHGKFYFEPYAKEPADLQEATWPVEPTFEDGKIIIGLIWDKSLEGMINIGDEVLRMGKFDYSTMPICEIITTERNIPEDAVVIVLKDKFSGEIKELQIAKQNL
mgnify:CR=1 FL=1